MVAAPVTAPHNSSLYRRAAARRALSLPPAGDYALLSTGRVEPIAANAPRAIPFRRVQTAQGYLPRWRAAMRRRKAD